MAAEIVHEQLPLCCGIIFLRNFEKRTDPVDWSRYGTVEQRVAYGYTDAYIKNYEEVHKPETKEEYRKRVADYLKTHIEAFETQKSYSLIALNVAENNIIGDVILESGFEILIPMMRNPSGTEIILYVKYHIKKPKEIKSKKSVLAK